MLRSGPVGFGVGLAPRTLVAGHDGVKEGHHPRRGQAFVHHAAGAAGDQSQPVAAPPQVVQQRPHAGHQAGVELLAEQGPFPGGQLPGLPVRTGPAQEALRQPLGRPLGRRALQGKEFPGRELDAQRGQGLLPGRQVHGRRGQHHAVHVKDDGPRRACRGADVGGQLLQAADARAEGLWLAVAPVDEHRIQARPTGALDVVAQVIAHVEQPLVGVARSVRRQVKDAPVGLGQPHLR